MSGVALSKDGGDDRCNSWHAKIYGAELRKKIADTLLKGGEGCRVDYKGEGLGYM